MSLFTAENFNALIEFLATHKEEIALVVTLIVTLAQAIKAKLQAREAIILLLNVLKDEDKMTASGQFKDATLKKIDQVAQVAQVGTTAVAEVKQVITDVNRGGLKLGSYNGKPVYLEDVGRIGSRLGAALSIVRGILRK